MTELVVQGRLISAADLAWIGGVIEANPQWGRWRLSLYIAEQWQWRNGVGQLKDMAVRSLLLKLERRGLISLPPRQRGGHGNHPARRRVAELSLDLFEGRRQGGSLDCLRPLRVVLVENAPQRRLLGRLLQQHHYLGYYRPVGENLPYLVESRCGEPVACALFGAAAWKCAPRDQFIGWSPQAREQQLQLVANNMRLLILPQFRVPQLGSHILSMLTRRLRGDWQGKYGHSIDLLETFVDKERFMGTVYRAANWIHVGQTQGRGRQGPDPRIRSTSIKDVYLLPLHTRFREVLQAQPTASS